MTDVLGLPLDTAIKALKTVGRVVEIAAPRGNITRGTLRVVRVTDDEITCALFPDALNDKNKQTTEVNRDTDNEA